MRLKPGEFLSTPEEIHAFWIGFFEVLCPWPSRYRIAKEQWDEIINEYHYYLCGRGLAVLVWLAIAKLIQVAFW